MADAQQALDAYLTLLKQKGASTASINQRKHYLRYLLKELEGASVDSMVYRVAVEQTLRKVVTDDTRGFFLTITREFYPFWSEDLKDIARQHNDDTYVLDTIQLPVFLNLITLFEEMDAAGWEINDIPPLRQYLSVCRANGVEDAVLDMRDRFLRAVHFLIRNHPIQPGVYRTGVQAMLSLAPREEVKQALLAVIREYYAYWQTSTESNYPPAFFNFGELPLPPAGPIIPTR